MVPLEKRAKAGTLKETSRTPTTRRRRRGRFQKSDPRERTSRNLRSMSRTKTSNDARNRTTRVGDSQKITRGCAGRSGTRRLAEHVVQRVHVVEQWRQGRAETLRKSLVDSRTKSTSTRIERKYKGRVDETTGALGTHCKAL